jgi:hypothetical protein
MEARDLNGAIDYRDIRYGRGNSDQANANRFLHKLKASRLRRDARIHTIGEIKGLSDGGKW